MRGLLVEVKGEGLYLPALDLWLDPRGGGERAFVSHAHGDHGGLDRGAGSILASAQTLALLAARRATPLHDARALEWGDSIELPIAADHGGGTARLSIAPAGHVLGAAQLIVDHPGGRLVYTGDYRTGPGATHATGAPVPCDELVIESTFGLPIFRFPPRDATLARIVDWCRAALDEGEVPVLLGYALGKAQELVHASLAAGLPTVAHGAVHRVCAAYEALGISLGVGDGRLIPYASWTATRERDRTAAVIVAPPQTQGQPMIRKMRRARVAYVSGWALIDAAVEQRRADAGFALSDHADYDDLIDTARATGARRVYATHGDDSALFARLVHEATGIETRALESAPLDGPLDGTASSTATATTSGPEAVG
ncbi:MAG: ligase-associated DNA damage response exonuclease [Polyangiales bacterium]